jgi:hypothetical protein
MMTLRARACGQSRMLTGARTGERVSTSTSQGAPESTGKLLIRCNSAQASRRAVLYVHVAGDPLPPADLTTWFTERAFHFYVAGLRLPARALRSARPAGRGVREAFSELDGACAQLRQADGMASVIVTAQGRAAAAAALWAGRTRPDDGPAAQADALILSAPAWAARRDLRLNISCPVLIMASEGGATTASHVWPRRRRTRVQPMQLGSHVTWLALPDAGTDQRAYLAELGRWLGAYMYGQARDQLL